MHIVKNASGSYRTTAFSLQKDIFSKINSKWLEDQSRVSICLSERNQISTAIVKLILEFSETTIFFKYFFIISKNMLLRSKHLKSIHFLKIPNNFSYLSN